MLDRNFISEKICFKFDKQISNLKKVPTRFPMEGLSTNKNFVIKVWNKNKSTLSFISPFPMRHHTIRCYFTEMYT